MLTDRNTEKLARKVSDLLSADPQFSAAMPDRAVSELILRNDISWIDIMRAVAQGYADRPALGRRAYELVRNGAGQQSVNVLPRFDTVTYRQLWTRVTSIAAALADSGAAPGDRVATIGFCSVDYTAVDMAIPHLGAVAVPLHAGAPVSQLANVAKETEPGVIACSTEYLARRRHAHSGGTDTTFVGGVRL